jgi:SET domain-containing protein
MSYNFYKPLPDFLELKKSKIHGLGLFAKKDLDKDYILGISHVQDKRFENGYIRTPLGGFFNHTDKDPNIEPVHVGDLIILKTTRFINAGEELKAIYTLYKPK